MTTPSKEDAAKALFTLATGTSSPFACYETILKFFGLHSSTGFNEAIRSTASILAHEIIKLISPGENHRFLDENDKLQAHDEVLSGGHWECVLCGFGSKPSAGYAYRRLLIADKPPDQAEKDVDKIP